MNQYDAHVKTYYLYWFTCEFCGTPVGTFGLICGCLPPLQIVVYNDLGVVVEYSGPIGCLSPEDAFFKRRIK